MGSYFKKELLDINQIFNGQIIQIKIRFKFQISYSYKYLHLFRVESMGATCAYKFMCIQIYVRTFIQINCILDGFPKKLNCYESSFEVYKSKNHMVDKK